MTYPDILVRRGARAVYRALCAAGAPGCTHEQIAAHAGFTGGMKGVRARNTSAFTDIRSALREHGLTVITERSNKVDTLFRLAALSEPLAATDYDDPHPVIAGIRTYQHVVGAEFDTAGAKVRLPFLPSLHEVRA